MRLLFLVAALLATTAAAAADATTLAWRLEKGAVLRYRHTSEQDATQQLADGGAGNEPTTTRQKQQVDYSLTILDVDAATGAARVLCRYEQVAVELDQMTLGRVRWDSRKREDLARSDEPAVKPFARLVGQEFSFLLSPAGAVSDLRGHDKVRAAILVGLEDSPFAKLALGSAFGDEAVRSDLERAFAFLPPGPVAPGATWTHGYPAPLPLLGTLRYDLALELAKIEDEKAEIPYTVSLARAAAPTATADPIAASIEVTFEGGKGAGKAVFGTRLGRLLSNEAEIEMSLATRLLPPVAPRDGAGAASARSRVKQRVRVDLLTD